MQDKAGMPAPTAQPKGWLLVCHSPRYDSDGQYAILELIQWGNAGGM